MKNNNNIFTTLGASNHTKDEREEHDFYATDPIAAEKLLQNETFSHDIWECACGCKHLSNVFEKRGFNVRSSDIIDRGGNEVYNFLSIDNTDWNGDIITNPPYSLALEFIERAINIVHEGHKVAMFLRLLFLEGKRRGEFFRLHPPARVIVSSERILCAKNGDFDKMLKNGGSAVAYAWFIWVKGYKGETKLSWI